MNRKGILGLSLEQVIGLVIGSILIIGMIFFVSNITGLIANKPDQSTINSFSALVKTVNQLVDAPQNEETLLTEFPEHKIVPAEGNKVQAVIPISLQPDYSIVAFDKETNEQECGFPDYTFEKPVSCLNLPCLCLFSSGWRIGSYDPLSCEQIKKINFIYAINSGQERYNLGKEHGRGVPGENLALWSDCKNSPVFGVKNIKIIRLPNGDKFDLLFEIPAKER